MTPDAQAVFVTGSTMRHVVTMTATGSVGLIAIFAVDLMSLFYIAQFGDRTLTAGVGFATVVLFLAVSINVGTMIAATALVARALGAGQPEEARGLASSLVALATIVGAIVSLVLLPLLPWLLKAIGASPEALPIAQRFLVIALPSNLLMALGMALSGCLRAVGDAQRAMWVTLAGGIATAILDPLLIFGLGLGVDGAAIATVLSRVVFCGVGLYGAVKVHGLVGWPTARLVRDIRPAIGIAGPAVMTNVATPIASAFVTAVLARYGDEVVAATAIIDRLTPVAFCGLFALSGAVGPILGQNFGARRFDRMRAALRDGLVFAGIYVLVMWAVLVLGRDAIVALFAAEGLTAQTVRFFCLISGALWLSIGALFVANAAFNNLGFALYSTAFNWGRAIIGTVPFALAGAWAGGVEGALLGLVVGAVGFGAAAIVVAFRVIDRLETGAMAAVAAPQRAA